MDIKSRKIRYYCLNDACLQVFWTDWRWWMKSCPLCRYEGAEEITTDLRQL